jgi:cobalt/nickel transport system permease protein
MHIPDGFLTPPLWGSLDAIGAGALFFGLRHTARTLKERTVPLMGVLSAFVFAAQMVNLPNVGGTSSHFLGGTLVGVLLGPWAGLVVMAVTLIVQCLLFQDGGVAALGANIVNMGLLGSLVSALVYRLAYRLWPTKRKVFWSAFVASWLSIEFSALACAAELAASHVISFRLGASLIGGVHALIGLLEGLVTGTILEAVRKTRPDLFPASVEESAR